MKNQMKKYPVNKYQKYELTVVICALVGIALIVLVPLVLDAIFH